ncbi:MAG: hypothetical protein NTW49_03415 [Bacteroidia bacterium]|nr:hypothetical protein [Bacteroidia bacterium]
MHNTWRKPLIYLAMAVLLLFSSCIDKLNNFFKKPPVTPVSQTIKTSVALGFAASVAWSYFKGYNLPYTNISVNNSTTAIYLDASQCYPFRYSSDHFGEMVILAVKISDDIAIMSVLFTRTDIYAGKFVLRDVITFPVINRDNQITVVYTEEDINIGGGPDTTMEINLSQDQINIELLKLSTPKPTDENIAIKQDAWIIDVNTNGTPDDFSDDIYTINGGAQKMAVNINETATSTSVYQLAMIQTIFSDQCLSNPSAGYALLQLVDLSQGGNGTLNSLVMGTTLFTFHDNCDGNAEITVATGNYITSTGDNIFLGLQ